jgi:uncharacterized protein YkwD
MARRSLPSFFVIALFALYAPSFARNTVFVSGASASADEFRIFDLINRERERMRLSPLGWDDQLADFARSYSVRMARGGFFDHEDRNGNYVNQRAEEAGITHWRRIGENLFVCEGIRNVSGFAVDQWMNSDTHRQNILDRKYNVTGIGMARDRNGRIYITEVFIQN